MECLFNDGIEFLEFIDSLIKPIRESDEFVRAMLLYTFDTIPDEIKRTSYYMFFCNDYVEIEIERYGIHKLYISLSSISKILDMKLNIQNFGVTQIISKLIIIAEKEFIMKSKDIVGELSEVVLVVDGEDNDLDYIPGFSLNSRILCTQKYFNSIKNIPIYCCYTMSKNETNIDIIFTLISLYKNKYNLRLGKVKLIFDYIPSKDFIIDIINKLKDVLLELEILVIDVQGENSEYHMSIGVLDGVIQSLIENNMLSTFSENFSLCFSKLNVSCEYRNDISDNKKIKFKPIKGDKDITHRLLKLDEVHLYYLDEVL